MGIFDYFQQAKPQDQIPSTDLVADDASNQLQAELDAHLTVVESEHTAASAAQLDYSIDHWVLESTQTLPQVTWAPADEFPSAPSTQTQRTYGCRYVRSDEAMILRPLTITSQQLDSTGRQLA